MMVEEGLIEADVRRIGAEQEMFLVGPGFRPAPLVMEMLQALKDPHFTTELAQFNLEANMEPLSFGGKCLSDMERAALRPSSTRRAPAPPISAPRSLSWEFFPRSGSPTSGSRTWRRCRGTSR